MGLGNGLYCRYIRSEVNKKLKVESGKFFTINFQFYTKKDLLSKQVFFLLHRLNQCHYEWYCNQRQKGGNAHKTCGIFSVSSKVYRKHGRITCGGCCGRKYRTTKEYSSESNPIHYSKSNQGNYYQLQKTTKKDICVVFCEF